MQRVRHGRACTDITLAAIAIGRRITESKDFPSATPRVYRRTEGAVRRYTKRHRCETFVLADRVDSPTQRNPPP